MSIFSKSGATKYDTMVALTDDGVQKLEKGQIPNKREYDVMSAMRVLQPCTNANEIARQLGVGWSETKVFDVLIKLSEQKLIVKR